MQKKNNWWLCQLMVLMVLFLFACSDSPPSPFSGMDEVHSTEMAWLDPIAAPHSILRWCDFHRESTAVRFCPFHSQIALKISWQVTTVALPEKSQRSAGFGLISYPGGSWVGLATASNQSMIAIANMGDLKSSLIISMKADDIELKEISNHQFSLKSRNTPGPAFELTIDGADHIDREANAMQVRVSQGDQIKIGLRVQNVPKDTVGRHYAHRDIDLRSLASASTNAWQEVFNKLEIKSYDVGVANDVLRNIYLSNQTYGNLQGHYWFDSTFLQDPASLALTSLVAPEEIGPMITTLGSQFERGGFPSLPIVERLLPIWMADSYFKEYRDYDVNHYYQLLLQEGSSSQNLASGSSPLVAWARSRLSFVLGREDRDVRFQAPVSKQFMGAKIWDAPDLVHDIRALINSVGGREAFVDSLDMLLEGVDQRRKLGMNQLQILPYLYNYAGAPWKTQERIHQIRLEDSIRLLNSESYHFSQIFGALGFYPVNPAEGIYVIGTPSLTKAVLHLENGQSFTFRAHFLTSENKYIQTAMLNEQPLSRCYLRHFEMMAGGELVLEMGPQPNYLHWVDEEALPPSASDPESDAW